jgi:two-component system phosphate regulon response regulator PhoB
MLFYQAPKQALVIATRPAAFDPIAKACRLGGFSVRRISKLQSATRLLAIELPTIIIVDTVTPLTAVLDWVRCLREVPLTSRISIVVTSPSKDADTAVQVLDAGADDYVTWPGSPDELLARLNAVVRCRKPELGTFEIAYGPLTIRPADRQVFAAMGETAPRKVDVGPTEFRLLHYFAMNPGAVHTRESLLSRLWPAGHGTTQRTVDAHIRGLRRALEQAGLPPLVETVLMSGYRLMLPETAKPFA